MEKDIELDKKIGTIRLSSFKCNCCSNEFLSNIQATNCTFCGSKLNEESCIGSLEVIDKRDLNKKIDKMIESLKDISDNHKSQEENSKMLDFVLDFIKDENIEIPWSGASLFINLDLEYDKMVPWQFLHSVKFDFQFKNQKKIEEELKIAINNSFSIDEMAENPVLKINK